MDTSLKIKQKLQKRMAVDKKSRSDIEAACYISTISVLWYKTIGNLVAHVYINLHVGATGIRTYVEEHYWWPVRRQLWGTGARAPPHQLLIIFSSL